MDHHIKEYYHQFSDGSPSGNFHKVIALHHTPDLKWKAVNKMVPKMCKGWYELAHLSSRDRIDFTHDFWVAKLPYHQKLPPFLDRFFDSLDDVGIFITQQKYDDPFEAHLVYSRKGDSGFYRGQPPALDDDIIEMEKAFPNFIFPADYIAFLKIHDGFCKTTDSTGITKARQMAPCYRQFQEMLAMENLFVVGEGEAVNPKTLIPFYESFGMPFYQCFWGEWYPNNEMGNIYYSGVTKTLSAVTPSQLNPDNMAFPTFTEWLIFYLETIA